MAYVNTVELFNWLLNTFKFAYGLIINIYYVYLENTFSVKPLQQF